MCGIWGYLGKESSLDTLVSVAHRGPNDFGSHSFSTPAGNLDVVSWRLSVLDLSSHAHQPMSYADGRYWIVYNGEIYNYRELRKELETKGHRFRSEGDTEVLLASYAQWGEECLSRFNGMFAFCLWDQESGKLFVARDRFGIKPLYYYNSPKGIGFASEIKQFFGLPDFLSVMNSQRAYEFIAHGFLDHTNETLFHSVYQLRGGESISISTDHWRPGQPLSIKRWYQLSQQQPYRGSFKMAIQEFHKLFEHVVRIHMRSDVSLGTCLSGGMDSSSIMGISNFLLKQAEFSHPQKTFSSCFQEAKYDERGYIEEVVSHSNVDAHYIFARESDLFPSLEKLVWQYDEPLNSTTMFAQWNLFKAVRENGVIVTLDGQGGDEQLGSYPQFYAPFVLGLAAQFKVAKAFHEAALFKKYQSWSYFSLMNSLISNSVPLSWYLLLRKLNNQSKFPVWLNENSLISSGVDNSETWSFIKDVNGIKNMTELSIAMIEKTTIPMLLHWEDRSSMAWGVEARVPFMDHRLIEFTLSLPEDYKIQNGITKYILREAMVGAVPEKVRLRVDKMGFVTPEEFWMKTTLRDVFRQELISACDLFPDLFMKARLLEYFDKAVKGVVPFSNVFWRIITFGVWKKVFKVEL